MTIITKTTPVLDCFVFAPTMFHDDRGYFSELYKHTTNKFSAKQMNYSFSKAGTLRGLHRAPYAKLVTCAKGKIFDVCVDLRENSLTYGQNFYIDLDSNNLAQLFIPAGCAHGFYSYEDSVVIYLQDDEYKKNLDETYCYQNYNIPWPAIPKYISEKDETICN